MSYEDSGKLAKRHDPSEPHNGEREELSAVFDTERKTGKKTGRFLVGAAMVAALLMTTLGFARNVEFFAGEGGSAYTITKSSEALQHVVFKPHQPFSNYQHFSSYASLERLLSFLGNEYPAALACSTTAERDAMLQFVVLRPVGAEAEQVSATPAKEWPDGTGAYRRSSDATENLDGVGYFFER